MPFNASPCFVTCNNILYYIYIYINPWFGNPFIQTRQTRSGFRSKASATRGISSNGMCMCVWLRAFMLDQVVLNYVGGAYIYIRALAPQHVCRCGICGMDGAHVRVKACVHRLNELF